MQWFYYYFRLVIHHVQGATVNRVLVGEMVQEEIDQSLDPASLELPVKKNFKIHQNDPYLLVIEERPGMVRQRNAH